MPTSSGGGQRKRRSSDIIPTPAPLPRSQKLAHHVHVVARFRPPVTAEEQQDTRSFLVHPSGRSVDSADEAYHFELDRAFNEHATQEDVYEYVGRPVVCDVLDGYNGTVFAYGQTGSGKTYCMFGPDFPEPGAQGMIPRTAEQVFDHIEACADDSTEFTLRCSFLEVYREQMRDLLDPTNHSLKVKELPQRGLYVHGLTREYVTCAGEVMQVLRTGQHARAVAPTRVHEHSSRSHAIFMMQVEQRSAEGTERHGKLTLVDLAGSEKVCKSGCVGETLEEAKKINWSLSALGKVIDALAEQRPHVPYRDSRLTRVLEEALGGNCRTTLLVAASPLSQHCEETLSSLRFATRAQKVRNHAKVNYMYSSDQLLVLVGQLQKELAGALKQIACFSGNFPQSHREDTKQSRRKRSDSAGSGILKQGKTHIKVPPLDKLPQGEGFSDSHGAHHLKGDDASCGSARSIDSSATTCSDELAPETEVSPPYRDDETWRPLALAAREALKAMEAAMLAQETALEEGGLLNERPGGSSSSAATATAEAGAPESGAGTATISSPSRRARAAPDGPARGAHNRRASSNAHPADSGEGYILDNAALSERWRALRHAVDARSLHWRLQMERHKIETLSLELDMQRRHAEHLEKNLEALSGHMAVMMQDGKVDVMNESIRRLLPSILRARGDSSCGFSYCDTRRSDDTGAGAQGSALSSARHARIARPVPRGGSSARGALPDCSPRPPPHAEDVLRVAGTGEAMSTPASAVKPPRAGNAAAADAQPDYYSARLESLQLSHQELEARVAQLQSELEDRNRQVAELAGQLGAKDVQVSALHHEVSVRDALLAHLHDDAVKKAEHKDQEMERLVEQAMLPLTTILSSRQAATAQAVGERSVHVH